MVGSEPRICCISSTIAFKRASESMSDERTPDIFAEEPESPLATVIVKAVTSWNAAVRGEARSDSLAKGGSSNAKNAEAKA